MWDPYMRCSNTAGLPCAQCNLTYSKFYNKHEKLPPYIQYKGDFCARLGTLRETARMRRKKNNFNPKLSKVTTCIFNNQCI